MSKRPQLLHSVATKWLGPPQPSTILRPFSSSPSHNSREKPPSRPQPSPHLLSNHALAQQLASLKESLSEEPSPPKRKSPFSKPPPLPQIAEEHEHDEPPRLSLENDKELGAWLEKVAAASQQPTSHKKAFFSNQPPEKKTPPPTVLIISAPRDLLESDFYRVASLASQRSKHVSGWAGDLIKVIQARHHLTLEPREQYYLFFESREAAERYMEITKTRHARTVIIQDLQQEQSLPPSSPSPSTESPSDPPFPYSLSTPPTTPESYEPQPPTLIPPFCPLIFTHRTLPSLLSSHSSLQTARLIPYHLRHHLSNPTNPTLLDRSRVLIRLSGGKLTATSLLNLIQADSLARGLNWELINSHETFSSVVIRGFSLPLVPVKATRQKAKTSARGEWVEAEGKWSTDLEAEELAATENEEGEGGWLAGARKGVKLVEQREVAVYSRFVTSFTNPLEAKRFARVWHKREVVGPRNAERVVVNCSAMW
ncbi:hypothetical protein QBC35DRAFT_458137 [Podospora australis]|uniref:Uncharacterized protein n=1 Tax=Podospora australis TaxID=1536484 RepID=A0AAN6X5Q0_9PEZI|nr:hypothetical protein QBC35DRAFT_458137 [Podospora australis]